MRVRSAPWEEGGAVPVARAQRELVALHSLVVEHRERRARLRARRRQRVSRRAPPTPPGASECIVRRMHCAQGGAVRRRGRDRGAPAPGAPRGRGAGQACAYGSSMAGISAPFSTHAPATLGTRRVRLVRGEGRGGGDVRTTTRTKRHVGHAAALRRGREAARCGVMAPTTIARRVGWACTSFPAAPHCGAASSAAGAAPGSSDASGHAAHRRRGAVGAGAGAARLPA